MEVCPNCGTEVAPGAARCPTCGMPRDHNFTQIRPAPGTTPGSSVTTPSSEASLLGSLALERGPRRTRSLALLMTALAGAVVLGVVVAVILNATVLGQRAAEPDPPDGPAAPGSAVPSTLPSTLPSTPAPAPTPTRTPTTTPTPTSTPTKPTVAPSAVLGKVRSGLVGVVASTCSPATWSGHGTGAVIGPDLIVTAWPVVAQAVSVVVVDTKGRPVPATVQRADPAAGIAVLRTERKISGHQFALGSTALEAGQQWYGVAADRARGGDATVTKIKLGRLGVTARLGSDAIKGAVLTTLPVADHVAGAGVVDGQGRLVGITARYPGQDNLLVLDASRISTVLKGSATPAKASCDAPLGPNLAVRPAKGSNKVLESYWSRINSGDYDAVWSMLAPKLQQNREQTIDGWRSSYIFNIRLSAAGGGKVRADFDSIFAKGHGPKGLTCARWSLVYRFDGGKIAGAKPVTGSGHKRC